MQSENQTIIYAKPAVLSLQNTDAMQGPSLHEGSTVGSTVCDN